MTKPSVFDLYFHLSNAYITLYLVTEVEDDRVVLTSQGAAIVRVTVVELLQLLTSQRRAS